MARKKLCCKKKDVVKEKKRLPKWSIVLITLTIYCISLFLIHIPLLFRYNTAPTIGKIFMIIGSAIFPVGIIFLIIFVKRQAKIHHLPKDFITIVVLTIVYYLYILLSYFDENIWGSKIYYLAILCCVSIIYFAYSFISKFKNLFNGEKTIVSIFSLAVFFALLGAELKDDNGFLLIKIAIGLLYAVSIPCFIKTTLFSKRNEARKKHLILLMMVGIILGAGIIISFPFYVNWCGLQGENYTTFVSVYSALVGGGLTLSGVAWTIRHTANEKRKEELAKAKPIFTFNVNSPECGSSTSRRCIDYDLNPFTENKLIVEIENSNHSAFTITRVFHDKKWWLMGGNNVVLPNKTIVLDFYFKDNVNLYFEIEDNLKQKYYYSIEVIPTVFISNWAGSNNEYTIEKMKEVTLDEIEKQQKEKGQK